jgi:hypothetical protein
MNKDEIRLHNRLATVLGVSSEATQDALLEVVVARSKYEANFVINELREILEAPSNRDIQSRAVEVMAELNLLRKAAAESKVFQISHEITITVEAGSSWATVEIAPIYDPEFTGMPMNTRFGLAVLR